MMFNACRSVCDAHLMACSSLAALALIAALAVEENIRGDMDSGAPPSLCIASTPPHDTALHRTQATASHVTDAHVASAHAHVRLRSPPSVLPCAFGAGTLRCVRVIKDGGV